MQKIMKPMSGYLALLLAVILFIASIYFFAGSRDNGTFVLLGVFSFIASVFLSLGIIVISPITRG